MTLLDIFLSTHTHADTRVPCLPVSILPSSSQTPHPKRLSLEQVNKVPSKGYLVAGRRLQQNLFDHLSQLKAHSVDVS